MRRLKNRATQTKQLRALGASHDEGPSLCRASNLLCKGGLLDPTALDQLPEDAKHDVAGRREQHARRAAYLEWREQAARQLARKAGPLARLTHRPEDFYPRLDQARLRVCASCEETVYPAARKNQHIHGEQRRSPCHYCGDSHRLRDYIDHPTPRNENERWP
jgi:hypothetical protein